MIRAILDILIYRYTPFKSFFLFLNIFDKSIIYNIVISLYMDIFVVRSYGLITLYIVIMYYIKRLIKWNYNKFIYYYLFNMGGIFLFFLIGGSFNNIVVINSIYIIISYILRDKGIKLV